MDYKDKKKILSFTIPLPPKPKGRPRHGRTRDGRPVTFTPKSTRSFEAAVATIASAHIKKPFLEGPLRVDILAILARPKRLRRKKDPGGLIYAPKRPDLDNLVKSIWDGMASQWGDDAQVCAGEPVKVYAEIGGKPRVIVAISQLEGCPQLNERLMWAYSKDVDCSQ